MLIADEAMFQNRSEDAVRYGRADASVSQIARSVELQQLQKQLVLQIEMRENTPSARPIR